jgi:DNA-binding MarR family transcriptional regulator
VSGVTIRTVIPGAVIPGPRSAPRPPAPEPVREEAAETLRYALHGFLSAVRAGRGGGNGTGPHTARHRMLVAIADEHDFGPGRLAPALGLPAAEVHDLLAGLGREGLVEHVPPPVGKNSRARGGAPVRLTPAGLRELHRMDADFRQQWEQALADVDPGDLHGAARVLSRLTAVVAPRNC